MHSHPILSCKAAAEFEKAYFRCHNESEEVVMYRAGRSVALAIEEDFDEIGGFPLAPKIVILAGKGHNAGDAFICANSLLDRHPDAQVLTLLAFPVKELRPGVKAPFELLKARSRIIEVDEETNLSKVMEKFTGTNCVDLCIDGILGMNAYPPLRSLPLKIISFINQFPAIRLRAAIDIPTGLSDDPDPNAFVADFTYATGIAKLPLLATRWISHVGRVRYLDLGFFKSCNHLETPARILKESLLWKLASLRRNLVHKRNFGHLMLFAGSDSMPGACIMSSLAAVQTGTGLITVVTTDPIVQMAAAQLPECMWIRNGGKFLTPDALTKVSDRMNDVSVLLLGPGLGRSEETREMVLQAVTTIDKPLLLDADALFPDLINALEKRPDSFPKVVLTPHEGEWNRLKEHLPNNVCEDDLSAMNRLCKDLRMVLLLKGPRTRIFCENNVYLSPFGGPVLARGGTGDLLAGMVGSLLAQKPENMVEAVIMGAAWHGRAADALVRSRGNCAVRTTQLIDFLPQALGFSN